MTPYRSIDYIINGHHSSHIMVTAEVVSVGLELSCHHITLTPLQGMPAQSGSYFCMNVFILCCHKVFSVYCNAFNRKVFTKRYGDIFWLRK